MYRIFYKKILPNVHPFLFLLVSLVFSYYSTMMETSPDEVIRPFLVLAFILLLLFPLSVRIAGGWDMAGILLTIVVLGLTFEPDYFPRVAVFSALIVSLHYIYSAVFRRRFLVVDISWSLNFASFFILIFEIAWLSSFFGAIPFSYYAAMAGRKESSLVSLSASGASPKPDIYYIVVDSYPRADILQSVFHYDNSNYIDRLEGMGFVVPQKVASNYPRTALSVSSTLDMQYWETISPDMDNVMFWWTTKPVIRHSRVRQSLEAIGYQSVSFASDWGITDNPSVDIYFNVYPVRLTDYENYITNYTPLGSFLSLFQSVAPALTNETHRRYTMNILENLKNVPKIKGAKFIFAHIIPPHAPLVFDANGNPVDFGQEFSFVMHNITREEEREGFLNQVKFINSQLLMTVEAILEQSATPPIIILQADHGSGYYYSFNSLESACLEERFSPFGAYYLPGVEPNAIPQDLTTVNLFRIIFNEYFDAQLPILENRQYYTVGQNLFIGMKEVTDIMKRPCVFPEE